MTLNLKAHAYIAKSILSRREGGIETLAAGLELPTSDPCYGA